SGGVDLSRSRRHVAGCGARRGVQELDVPGDGGHVLARHRRPARAAPRARARRGRAVRDPPLPRPRAVVRLDPRAAHREGVRMSGQTAARRPRGAQAFRPACGRLDLAALKGCATVALVLITTLCSACARRAAGTPPSNDLLIVGYDREPDTLNRFSTHI